MWKSFGGQDLVKVWVLVKPQFGLRFWLLSSIMRYLPPPQVPKFGWHSYCSMYLVFSFTYLSMWKSFGVQDLVKVWVLVKPQFKLLFWLLSGIMRSLPPPQVPKFGWHSYCSMYLVFSFTYLLMWSFGVQGLVVKVWVLVKAQLKLCSDLFPASRGIYHHHMYLNSGDIVIVCILLLVS